MDTDYLQKCLRQISSARMRSSRALFSTSLAGKNRLKIPKQAIPVKIMVI
jgi:hypothetical protein